MTTVSSIHSQLLHSFHLTRLCRPQHSIHRGQITESLLQIVGIIAPILSHLCLLNCINEARHLVLISHHAKRLCICRICLYNRHFPTGLHLPAFLLHHVHPHVYPPFRTYYRNEVLPLQIFASGKGDVIRHTNTIRGLQCRGDCVHRGEAFFYLPAKGKRAGKFPA